MPTAGLHSLYPSVDEIFVFPRKEGHKAMSYLLPSETKILIILRGIHITDSRTLTIFGNYQGYREMKLLLIIEYNLT